MAFCDLMALLKDAASQSLPNLPLISCTRHRAVKLGNGMTLVPQFKLIRFVPRPLCLPDEDVTAPPLGDSWGARDATPATPSRSNGATADVALHGQPAPLATEPKGAPAWPAPAPGGEPLIDDEIPF
jgi:hypothetical protein